MQTQAQPETLSKRCVDEMMSALSSRAHPAKLAADMQKVLHNSEPVHNLQELQHRLESIGSRNMRYTDSYRPQEPQNQLESTGSPVMRYSDWYRHGISPAAPTAAPNEEGNGIDRLDSKSILHGFGGYDRWTGAQGPLAAGRAVEDLSGLSWADQPSPGTQL